MGDLIDQVRYGCERIAWLAPPRYQAEALHALRWIRDDMPTDPATSQYLSPTTNRRGALGGGVSNGAT